MVELTEREKEILNATEYRFTMKVAWMIAAAFSLTMSIIAIIVAAIMCFIRKG